MDYYHFIMLLVLTSLLWEGRSSDGDPRSSDSEAHLFCCFLFCCSGVLLLINSFPVPCSPVYMLKVVLCLAGSGSQLVTLQSSDRKIQLIWFDLTCILLTTRDKKNVQSISFLNPQITTVPFKPYPFIIGVIWKLQMSFIDTNRNWFSCMQWLGII